MCGHGYGMHAGVGATAANYINFLSAEFEYRVLKIRLSRRPLNILLPADQICSVVFKI
jgi:hypothetical protein